MKLNKFHFLTVFFSHRLVVAPKTFCFLLLLIHFCRRSWRAVEDLSYGNKVKRKRERKKKVIPTWGSLILEGNSIHNTISTLVSFILVVSPRHHLEIYDFECTHFRAGFVVVPSTHSRRRSSSTFSKVTQWRI